MTRITRRLFDGKISIFKRRKTSYGGASKPSNKFREQRPASLEEGLETSSATPPLSDDSSASRESREADVFLKAFSPICMLWLFMSSKMVFEENIDVMRLKDFCDIVGHVCNATCCKTKN